MLEQSYDNIKRYVNYITSISKNHLTDWGLGDWVPVKSKATKELTSSIYYYVDAMILSKAAGLMNQAADVEKYARLSENIRNAINKKYLNQETGMYANGLQTELSAPLYWGIVPPALKQKVADNLARRVIADNKHVDVGLLGTKTILNALSENGYADLAYEVASQETFPSWGYWIKNGATTLYENWAIDAKYDVSRNHIMFGEIGAWFYKALGGIRYDAEKPGFKNVILKPNFVAGLKHFEAAHDGPHGKIASSWKREEAGIAYSVVIPANSSATVFLPQLNGKKIYLNGKPLVITKVASKAGAANNAIPYNVGAGRYVFQWK
jgi:alpha-L-rhamnosidase